MVGFVVEIKSLMKNPYFYVNVMILWKLEMMKNHKKCIDAVEKFELVHLMTSVGINFKNKAWSRKTFSRLNIFDFNLSHKY